MKPNYKWSKKKTTLNGQFPPSQNYHIFFFFDYFKSCINFFKNWQLINIFRDYINEFWFVLKTTWSDITRVWIITNNLSSTSLHVQWNLFQTFFCYQSQRIIHVSDLCTLYFRMLWTSCNIMLRWRLYRPHTCSMTINGPLLCWFWASSQLLL